jgi:formylglycine-generating enzyme required for sulfatase activity/serine/threonine protein kinase
MTDESLFAAALEQLTPGERSSYLDTACGDPGQRARLDSLLAAHDRAGTFLGRPAVDPPDDNTRAAPADDSNTRTTDPDGPPADDNATTFLAPSDRPGSLGRLGHYEVLEVLGRGGFGIVYRVFDDHLQRVVAVKVLAPHLATTSPARKRFLREARSAAAVQHDNVVRIHHVEEQPLPHLVMEYIPGETLQQRMNRTGPLETAEAVRVGRQIAEGLAAAHAKGLIHRDIKPSNILLDTSPHPSAKITDFGLARAADDASLTTSGAVAGTPMYMAPEQAKGEPLDHRADLFSLGSVLYAMLSGRPPFRANSTPAVLKRVADDTPRPIREIIPEVPVWFCRIVEKLHAKDPAERFQSAREVADLLADCEKQLAERKELTDFARIPGGKPKRKAGRWKWAGVGVATVLVVLLVAMWGNLISKVKQSLYHELTVQLPDTTTVAQFWETTDTVERENRWTLTSEWPFEPKATVANTRERTLRLPPGNYYMFVTRDGKRIEQRLLTIGWGGAQTLTAASAPPPPPSTDGSRPETYKNTLGMEFVRVPKGKAWLGGGKDRPGDREVEFPADFDLGKYEVTQEQWEKVTGANPSYFSRGGEGRDMVQAVPDADLKRFPVEDVTWDGCQAFVAKLNELEKGSGWVYRLPTGDEWEYACRGGPMADKTDSAFDYYFAQPTNTLSPQLANVGDLKGLQRTCKVGTYEGNRLGLFDMHGNVQEWCDGGGEKKQLRGGSFRRGNGWASSYLTTARGSFVGLGLRLARVPVAAASPAVPATAADVLPFLAGGWKAEKQDFDPALRPEQGLTVEEVTFDRVAGGRVLALRTRDACFLYSFDPADGGVRVWHLNARGLVVGPVRGEFNAQKRSAVWRQPLGEDKEFVHEIDFPDANALTARVFRRDTKTNAVHKISYTFTRLTGPAPPPGRTTDPTRPAEMAVLDRMAGEWQNEQTVTDAATPDKPRRETFRVKAESILGGRFVEEVISNETTGGSEYTLAWFDPAAKKYRRWYFTDGGQFTELTGEWHDGTKTLAWAATDGSVTVREVFKGDDRSEFHLTFKNKGGKTVRETTGVARRVTPPPADAPKPPKSPAVPFDEKEAKAHQEAWAKHLGTKVQFADAKLGMELRVIPPGEFLMGSPEKQLKADGEANHPDIAKLIQREYDAETPPHTVRITRPFAVGRCEVTVGQFRKFAEAEKYVSTVENGGGSGLVNGELVPDKQFSWKEVGYKQADLAPVWNVSAADAEEFCKWLSRETGQTFRLPTEAEWEWACRAGTAGRTFFAEKDIHTFAWGPASKTKEGTKGESTAKKDGPQPVGQKEPNPFGLHDTCGNVWEWCSDWYGEKYYTTLPADRPTDDPTGPPAPARGRANHRVQRGGSVFKLGNVFSNSTSRPVVEQQGCGFRVVMELPAKPTGK